MTLDFDVIKLHLNVATVRRVGKGALCAVPTISDAKDGGHAIDPRARAVRWLLPTLRYLK
jgi:hypothetical protein